MYLTAQKEIKPFKKDDTRYDARFSKEPLASKKFGKFDVIYSVFFLQDHKPRTNFFIDSVSSINFQHACFYRNVARVSSRLVKLKLVGLAYVKVTTNKMQVGAGSTSLSYNEKLCLTRNRKEILFAV